MQSPDTYRIISEGNDRFVRSLYHDQNSPEFRAFSGSFRSQLERMLRFLTKDLPITNPPVTVEKTGPAGFLPPPVKRQLVAENFQGHTFVPERVYHEEESSREPEKVVDKVTLQLLAEVFPLTHTNRAQVRTIINTIQRAFEFVKDGSYVLAPTPEEDIRLKIRQIQAELYLAANDVAGDCRLTKHTLNNKEDTLLAGEACSTQMSQALRFDLVRAPNKEKLSQVPIIQVINEGLTDNSKGMRVPVAVNWADLFKYDYQGIYRDILVKPGSVLHGQLIMAVDPRELSLGRFSIDNGQIRFDPV